MINTIPTELTRTIALILIVFAPIATAEQRRSLGFSVADWEDVLLQRGALINLAYDGDFRNRTVWVYEAGDFKSGSLTLECFTAEGQPLETLECAVQVTIPLSSAHAHTRDFVADTFAYILTLAELSVLNNAERAEAVSDWLIEQMELASVTTNTHDVLVFKDGLYFYWHYLPSLRSFEMRVRILEGDDLMAMLKRTSQLSP